MGRRLVTSFVAFAFVLLGVPVAGSALAASPDTVISQVYGGGGNTGATYKNDFIELFNRGGSVVSVAGWSVQYASTAGTLASGTLAASATDRAGNTATASTTFTVIVDASSLCAVTRTLAGKSGDPFAQSSQRPRRRSGAATRRRRALRSART